MQSAKCKSNRSILTSAICNLTSLLSVFSVFSVVLSWDSGSSFCLTFPHFRL
jgi:hypothetical protein